MKVSHKLALALGLGIATVMGANAWVRIQLEVHRFGGDQAADMAREGRRLARAAGWIHATEGEARARRLVQDLGVRDARSTLAWVQIEDLASSGRVSAAGRETLQRGGTLAFMERQVRGGSRRTTLVPVPGTHDAALQISEPASPSGAYLRRRIAQQVGASALVLVACVVLAVALGTWLVGRPLQRLCDRARRIGEGDLDSRLDIGTRDEIGELGAEIDAMCDRLAEANRVAARETDARLTAFEQVRHADRLKTVGQLASGVAHELGTPLNVVLGRARMIVTDTPPPGSEVAKNAQIVIEQTNRMAAIIRQLLDFSRRQRPRLERCALQRIAERAVAMLEPHARYGGVAIDLRVSEVPEPHGDEEQLLQALTNLVLNGIHAMSSGGRLTVEVGCARVRPPVNVGAPEGDYAYLAVEDEGSGIPDDVLPRVFEPFFTTKAVGEGTGLGLSVAYGIVRDHGGWIDVDGNRRPGTRVSIFLPHSSAAAQPGSEVSA